VILLDNTQSAFELFPGKINFKNYIENSILVKSWMGDPKDETLLDLLSFLDALRFLDDVRTILGRRVNAKQLQ
jgi:CTD nuclear envelope phosphatase 1